MGQLTPGTDFPIQKKTCSLLVGETVLLEGTLGGPCLRVGLSATKGTAAARDLGSVSHQHKQASPSSADSGCRYLNQEDVVPRVSQE